MNFLESLRHGALKPVDGVLDHLGFLEASLVSSHLSKAQD